MRVDWSAAVIVWLITWGLATQALPALAEGYTALAYWCTAVATALVFLAGLLAHELSHSVTARRRGVAVRDIRLWALGGIATLESEPASPRDDLAIAVAGPVASAAISAGAFVLAVVLGIGGAPELAVAALVWLASINALLAAFNLLPAAPLDGGRVLRSVLWQRRGDRTSATISAARAGRFVGLGLVWLGLVEVVFVGLGGVWTTILGWFVLSAARDEEQAAVVSERLAGLRVADVMTSDPIVVPAALPVDRVLDEFVLRHPCSTFPLVDRHGVLVGLVTLSRLRDVAPERRATTAVGEVGWPLETLATARPDESLLAALHRVHDAGDGRLLVVDGGQLRGIVAPSDVARAARSAHPGAPRPAGW